MNNKIFYGDKLRLARLLKGLTQQQLGSEITASRQFVHQMESGLKSPSEEVLNALCESLNVYSLFFYTAMTNEVKYEQCHFRKRKTTPVNLANRVLAYATIFENLINLINQYIELPTENIPTTTSEKTYYSNIEIELAAEKCRKLWKLGLSAPISNMTRVLENAGVVITQFSGVSEKVDALSFNRKHPIVIRNSEKGSSCRLRFDLAHECGHLVMHEGIETGDTATESEANKFASAFLFPRTAFLKEFPSLKGRNLNWTLIYKLKIRWGMSARAIIYRAHSLDLITAQQYRSANVRLNKTGQTKIENHDEKVIREEPEVLMKALRILNSEIGISFSQIAKSLTISTKMLAIISNATNSYETSNSNVIPIRP